MQVFSFFWWVMQQGPATRTNGSTCALLEQREEQSCVSLPYLLLSAHPRQWSSQQLHDWFELSAAQHNLLQISMDGPSTKWKFLATFMKKRNEVFPEMPDILFPGSCGLHVVRGALKSGTQATTWNLASLLRFLYYLLHDVPARAEDCAECTGGAPIPKLFCCRRWCEDATVAGRAIPIWPSIQTDVKKLVSGPKGAMPKIQSFGNF